MTNQTEIQDLRRQVEQWVRGPFADPTVPKYPFTAGAAVDSLFRFLTAEGEAEPYASLGRDILSGLRYFLDHADVVKLCVRTEPFAAAILRLVDGNKFSVLWATAASKNPPTKPMLASMLKKDGLGLAENSTLSAQPDTLRGKPRFAEHLGRIYAHRNPEAHEAHDWIPQEKNRIFESVCVFLVFTVAEYRPQIESALLERRYRRYLTSLAERFKNSEGRLVDLRCVRFTPGEQFAVGTATDITDTIVPDALGSGRLHGPLPADRSSDALAVHSLLKNCNRFVLLGEPGAGKTTSLRQIAFRFATDLLNHPASGRPIPVYVELKTCTSQTGSRVADKIAGELHAGIQAPSSVFSGNLLLLLDGLNEVRTSERKPVREEIEELLRIHPTLAVVVSARREGYIGEIALLTYSLLSLGDEEIRQFLKREISPPELAAGVVAHLERDAKTWDICRNPWWLCKVTELARDWNTDLPKHRGQLLHRLIAKTLEREELQVGNQTEPLTKQHLLAFLALETRKKGERTFHWSRANELLIEGAEHLQKTKIDIPGFIDELRGNQLLVKFDQDLHSFRHELYQEFFAAVELRTRWQKAQREGRQFPLMGGLEWGETLRLFADLVDDHFEVARSLSEASPIVAAKIYLDAGREDAEVRATICDSAYLQATRTTHGHHWAGGVIALAELGEFERLRDVIPKLGEFTPEHRTVLALLAMGWPRSRSETFCEAEASRIAPLLIAALKQRRAWADLVYLARVTWNKNSPAVSEKYLAAAAGLGLFDKLLMTGVKLISAEGADVADMTVGACCVRKAAEAGLRPAWFCYGMILRRGMGVLPNYSDAAVWLRKAAQEQDAHAMVELADLLLAMPRIQQASGEPEEWLHRAERAGDQKAGQVRKDWMQCMVERRGSAMSGNVEDMEWLGDTLIGLPSLACEPCEGEKWLRLAATRSADAKLNLAERLLNGNALPQSCIEGEQLLREAAATSARAKLNLARRFLEGSGVSAKPCESETLLRELAVGGDLEAILELMTLAACRT